MTRGRAIRLAALCLLAVLCLLGVIGGWWLRSIGYFGGPIHTFVPAAPGRPGIAGTVAVYFSGDVGFHAGSGLPVARRMAAQGVSVLGVNSLDAYRYRRDPAWSAALVARTVDAALHLPGARRVLLIGQSFGANIVLAGASSLPPALKARVAMVQLVVPADAMLFHASPAGLLDFRDDGPALPYARRLAGLPVLCIHGEREKDSLCPLWHAPNATVLVLPGNHFLQHDHALIAATLLRAAEAIRLVPHLTAPATDGAS